MTIPEYEALRQADERLRRRLWIATCVVAAIFAISFSAVLVVSEALAHDATSTAYLAEKRRLHPGGTL